MSASQLHSTLVAQLVTTKVDLSHRKSGRNLYSIGFKLTGLKHTVINCCHCLFFISDYESINIGLLSNLRGKENNCLCKGTF